MTAALLLIGHCSAAVLWQEDFESASSIFETKLDDIYHAGGSDINYDLGPGHNSAKAFRWLSHDTGWYYARGTQFVSSPTGRFSVSFWMNTEITTLYRWIFSLDDPTHYTPYLTLFEGYIGYSNCDWGRLRSTNPDGTYRTICQLKTGWRQLKLIVDFNSKTFDVYYDDMSVPAATGLALGNTNVGPTSVFSPAFCGVNGGGRSSIDDIRIDSLPSAIPSTIPPGPAYSMASSLMSVNISQSVGALVGLTAGTRRMLDCTNDIYVLQGPVSSAFSREAQDVVTSSFGDSSSRTLNCTNIGLPGVIITKNYSFDASGQLVKRVAFSTTSTEGFLTYYSRLKLDTAFLADSYPDGYRYISATNAGSLTDLRTITFVSSKDYSAGFGVYRYKVNNRWVMPGASLPNPDGWDLTVFCDYLSPTKSPSGEVKIVSIPGDFTTYDIHLANTPEYASLYSDPKPAWTTNLVSDIMYCCTGDANSFAPIAAPLSVTETIWFLGPPWGNWWANSPIAPPTIPNSPADQAWIEGIAPGVRAGSSNAKVAAYTNTSFEAVSDIYTQHYDFGVKDRDGTILDAGCPSDVRGGATYFLQILNPTARQYWLDMHADRTQKWGMDFLYMDGGGAYAELQDWTLKAVAQNYDWVDFYRDLKARIKAVNSDGVFFTNGNPPYSDIGYIEWRDAEWQQLSGTYGASDAWRMLARSLLGAKFRDYPGFTWVPTYGGPNAQPAISTYSTAYGWCGHLPVFDYLPWACAALEYRGMRLVPTAVQQPWWREADPTYEAYGFTKGENAIVNVIGHSDATTSATVTFNRADLGLELGRKYLCRVMTMNNSALAPVPTTAFTKGTPSMFIVNSDTITLTLPVSKALLTSVVFSKVWVMVEHTGAKPCETRIPENYGVTARLASISGDFYRYNVVTKYAGAVVFFPFAISVNTPPGGSATQTTVDGVIGMRATCGAAGSYNFNVKTPNGIPSAKKSVTNTRVLIDNVVVTDNNVEPGSVFVETEDRACGIKLVTSQSLPVGQRIQFYGTFSRVDGEYQISNATIFQSAAGTPLDPVFMTTGAIGNDTTESLKYLGIDVTQLLVRFTGQVTGVIAGERVIYVDDGKNLQDGVGGFLGMRVHVPASASMPVAGDYVSITGIARPEKHTLSIASMVNGLSYPAGTVVYVPSVSARVSSDIQAVPPAL